MLDGGGGVGGGGDDAHVCLLWVRVTGCWPPSALLRVMEPLAPTALETKEGESPPSSRGSWPFNSTSVNSS